MRKAFTLLELAGDLLHNVVVGLWVLYSECRWLLCGDRARGALVRAARAREEALRLSLAQLTVIAAPERHQIERELSLLRADTDRLEAEHHRNRTLWRAALRDRFRSDFTS